MLVDTVINLGEHAEEAYADEESISLVIMSTSLEKMKKQNNYFILNYQEQKIKAQ